MTDDEKENLAASKVILTLTLLFFYLPILYIIVFSFNDSRSLTKFGGFSRAGMKRCSRTPR